MAGEASCSGHKKKTKLSRQESNKSGKDPEIDVDRPLAGVSSIQSKKGGSGIRVYKIVVLGDGGVGKSGIFMAVYLFLWFTDINNYCSGHSSVCQSQFSGLSWSYNR